MVTQSSSTCKTRIRRVDLWCQQHSRINFTNYVFELIVRTPKKSFEDISKRKNQYTRLARLGVHEYLTRHYQNRFYFRTEDVLLRQNQSQDGPRPRSREERSNFDRFAAWRASRPDVGTDLNFSEGTRPCLIADDIVIKIDEVRMEDPDPLAKLNFYHWHPQVNRQDRSDANKICLLAHDCIASCWRAKNFSM